MQKILGYMRKAIDQYNMIEDGDKIAVALSGGKDSTTMLLGLKNLQRFYPKKFDIIGITINPGFEFYDTTYLRNTCKDLNIPFVEEQSHTKEIVFDIRNEKNPCSLCAKLRRGILNNTAKELHCNKIALGHHADDLVETFMLSMFYEGRLSTFEPKTYLDKVDAYVIRPLLYVREIQIIGASKNLPILHNCCPADKNTKREYVKDLLKQINKDVPNVVEKIHGALIHGERNNLIPEITRKNKV